MNHEQLDLRRELLDLCDRIMATGVKQGAIAPGTLQQVAEVLHVSISIPDAGYRAVAVTYALRRLAEGIAPAVHKPIDEPPSQ